MGYIHMTKTKANLKEMPTFCWPEGRSPWTRRGSRRSSWPLSPQRSPTKVKRHGKMTSEYTKHHRNSGTKIEKDQKSCKMCNQNKLEITRFPPPHASKSNSELIPMLIFLALGVASRGESQLIRTFAFKLRKEKMGQRESKVATQQSYRSQSNLKPQAQVQNFEHFSPFHFNLKHIRKRIIRVSLVQ